MKFEQMTESARRVANAIWCTKGWGESLGCLLASTFDASADRPDDAKPDDDLCGFTPWASERANEVCQRIADEATADHARIVAEKDAEIERLKDQLKQAVTACSGAVPFLEWTGDRVPDEVKACEDVKERWEQTND